MSKAADEVLHDAMELPLSERAAVASELLASLDGKTEEAVEAAWATEITLRAARVRSGEAKGRPWPDVRADLERRRR
jgi:putative addiction module component (TIGR02574 family)